MSSEIKKIKLNDILEITSSKRIFSADYLDHGVPFYRSKEVIEKSKGKDISTELFISEDKFLSIKNRFGIPIEGDILLTSVGTIGIPYLVKSSDKFYFKDGNLTWFRNYSELINYDYLFCWLRSIDAKNKFNMITIGSTQKALTISSLKSIEIPLPPIKTQKKIAHILTTLDDKIEANGKMSITLQEIAQAIFKSWFVDFEPVHAKANASSDADFDSIAKDLGISREILDLFPDEFEESELGMIPKMWKVIYLDNILNFERGVEPGSKNYIINPTSVQIKKQDLIQFFRVKDLASKSNIYINKEIIMKGFVFYGEVLVSFDGTIGRVSSCLDGCFSSGIRKITAKSGLMNNSTIYYLMQSDYIQKIIMKYAEGTTILHASRSIPHLYIVHNQNIINAFEDLTKNIYKKILQNTLEINTLQKTRNTLLPKLLSGELEVSELELDHVAH